MRGAAVAAGLAAPSSLRGQQPALARIIVENDFSGDPDGLFQLAQPVISPSIDIAMFVGSHLPATSPFVRSQTTATDAVEKVNELLALMGKLVCTGD